MAGPVGNMTIKVDLDSTGFNKGMSGLNRQMKMVGSELASNLSVFDKTDKSVEKLRTRYDGLNKMQKIQEQRVKELKDKYDHLSETTGENSAKTQAAAAEYNKANAELNAMTKEVSELSAEIERMESPWTKVGNKLTDVGDKFQTVGSGMKDIGKSMSMYVTAPLVGLGVAATKTGVDFTRGMNEVGAISGATGEELEQLKDKAREMGANTKFSASEAAEGFKYMSLAGWDTSDMLDGIEGMMSLAAASGEELGAVSDIVTDGLTAFGLEAGESGRMADVLAAASANANTDVTGLGNAFKYVAPVAGSLGFTMEDTSKAIGLMSNAGIKGEKAGTALRTMMTNLAKPTKAMQGAMDELGVSITDQDGNMKSLDDIMEDLRESFSGMTEEQKANYAATIFGKEAMSGALAVINASEEDYNQLGDAINNSTGEAQRMAEQMEDGLPGALNRLRSTWEETMLQINEVIAPVLEKVVEFAIKVIQKFQGMSDSTKRLIVVLGGITAAIGPILVAGGTLLIWAGSLIKTIGTISLTIGKLGGLSKIFAPLTGAVKGLGVAFGFLTGPVGIAVAAVVGIGTAFTIAYAKSETFRNMIDSVVENVKLGIEWIVNLKDSIISLFQGDEDNGTKMLEKLGLSETMIEIISTQIEFVKQIFSTIFDTVSEVFTAVGGFIKQTINELVLFWEEHGQMIMESVSLVFKAIFEVISTTLNTIFQAIGAFIELTRPIWEAFMTTLKTVVTIAWNAIKLIIGTTLDVIKGIIAAVSALIQGDWRTFLNVLRSTAESIWTRIKNFITQSVNAIKNNINKYITLALNIMKNLLTQMWNSTKQRFTDMVNTARTKLGQFRDAVKNMMTQAKDRAIEQINKIVDGAKQMPGKMRDGIVAGKNKVVSGIKSLGNAMAGQLGKVVNGVIGGMNNVLGKVGVKASISKWNVPSFSRGTTGRGPGGHVRNDKIARDTLALVGDKGPGNGKGTRELVEYPNGKFGLYDNDQMIFAPKGTKIFNNKLTEEMLSYLPAFSRGTTGQGGLFGKAVSGVKKAGSFIGGGIKNIAEKAIDFLDAPKKVFDSIVNAVFGGFTGITKFMLRFAKGGWNKMKEALFDFLKRKFSEAGVGKKQKWMNYPMTTPYAPGGGIPGYNFNGGRHYGIDYGTPVGVNITAPTAGRVTKQSDHGGGNVARLDTGKASQYFLHMSSVKSGKVGVGESVGKSGNSGAFTTGPHVHWQLEDPKTPFLQNRNYKNPLSILKGHQFGGLIESEGLFRLGEGNNPEVVIPLNEPSQAMKLIAYVAEKMKGKSKQTSQLPDYRNNQDDSLMTRLIETQQEQIELLKSLLMKDTDIYMDGEKLSKDVDRRNLQREKRYDRFKGGVYI